MESREEDRPRIPVDQLQQSRPGRHRRPRNTWVALGERAIAGLRITGQLAVVLTFLDNHDALTWAARAIAEISEAMGRLGS